jgi:DNA-binding NtrC family response regulator
LNQEKETILIVDDQPSLGQTLKRFLEKHGYEAITCVSVDEAIERIDQDKIDLVITDMCMRERDGFELLDEIHMRGGSVPVVVMTAFATMDHAVESMRRGATDYIVKPFKLNEVKTTIEQALLRSRGPFPSPLTSNGHSRQGNKVHQVRGPATARTRLVGESKVMADVLRIVERIAPTDSSVLITGATGTGKELVARQIHELSNRRTRPFVDLNCSAIPDTLVEAELFGHQRGTFTGADETRPGLFEEASGGTVFLDEVDALSLSSQAKLLRVLQERLIRRVGGRKNIPIDVRIISATNKDLTHAVANGTFRHDLLYRLRVVPTHVPELRERPEDIPHLVEYFLEQHASRRGTSPKPVDPAAMKVMTEYTWPGNVRELENAIEYSLALGQSDQVQLEDLPPTLTGKAKAPETAPVLLQCLDNNLPLSEVERRYVLWMLERHDGHQINTAAALGIDRRTLSRRLHQYGSRTWDVT